MAGVNKVILVGNLGKDPEVKYLEGGVAMAKFPLATSETIKDRNGNKIEQTEWHNVVLWRGLAEIAEKYLRKGSTVFIEGKIRTRQWEDKDKNKRYTTEIVADSMTMLGGRRENNQNEYQAAGSSGFQSQPQNTQASQPQDTFAQTYAPGPDTDDLPF